MSDIVSDGEGMNDIDKNGIISDGEGMNDIDKDGINVLVIDLTELTDDEETESLEITTINKQYLVNINWKSTYLVQQL